LQINSEIIAKTGLIFGRKTRLEFQIIQENS